jgi:hypothetical protein
MRTLRSYIEQNQDGSGLGKMAFLMTAVTDELCYELEDLSPEAVQLHLAQIGEMIAWIGHGNNERLPENIRVMAEGIQPSESREEQEFKELFPAAVDSAELCRNPSLFP